MSFTSIEFLLFFPLISLIFFAVPYRFRWLCLVASSIYFYMAWKPWYVLLVLGTSLITWRLGLLIAQRDKNKRKQKTLLLLSCTAIFSPLLAFKYFDFLNTETGTLLTSVGIRYSIPNLNVILPIAISFYTFHCISYLVDVYRKHTTPEKNPILVILYLIFFPQLVSGPIVKSKELLPQLRALKANAISPIFAFDYDRVSSGLRLMLFGFFTKLIIADNLAPYVDEIFVSFEKRSALSIALATTLFGIQVFGDFAGYTYIALGSAKVFGINLVENFNQPYLAKSVIEFWKRWHISLTAWFRDYVFIPLGGNRVSETRRAINVILVFALSGAWHGANWTYLIWGLTHACLYLLTDLLEKIATCRVIASFRSSQVLCFFSEAVNWLITFAIISLSWLPFRTSTISDVGLFLNKITSQEDFKSEGWSDFSPFIAPKTPLLEILHISGVSIAIAGFLIVATIETYMKKGHRLSDWPTPARWAVYYLALSSIFLFGSFRDASFIYFQF